MSYSNASKLTFASKNHPINNFVIKTNSGNFIVREAIPTDYEKAAQFMVNTSIDTFEDWACYCKDPEVKKKQINFRTDIYHNNAAKVDGNTTMLLAEDKNKSINALFSMQSFDLIPEIAESRTGYVDECMISREHRNNGLGTILFKKLAETAQGYFTDIILESDIKSSSFYSRLGFKDIDISNPVLKSVSDLIIGNRPDPDYIRIMTKSINPKDPWWKRLKIK